MEVKLSPFIPCGSLMVQPSKSDAHRKIICSSFSSGRGTVDNIVMSDDITATIEALISSGCSIDIEDSNNYQGRSIVHIAGFINGLRKEKIIDCAESGSTLRFLSMIFALTGGKTTFIGRGRLPERPMNHALEFYDRNDVSYRIPGNGEYLPMVLDSSLSKVDLSIDCSVSSQFLSGILMGMAANCTKGTVTATGKFESKGYVEMTCGVLRQYGIDISGNNPFEFDGTNCMKNFDSITEGDWSNASYFIIMNHMGGKIDIKGLMSDSLQPDRALVKLIDKMSQGENNDLDLSEYPDLMPALAVYASTLPVITTLRGKRLRYKESDRISAVCNGLKNIGGEVSEFDEGLTIKGGNPITGGIVESFNDHRIAMAFSSLSCTAKGDIIIKDAGCINKSYPDFYIDLKSIGGKVV